QRIAQASHPGEHLAELAQLARSRVLRRERAEHLRKQVRRPAELNPPLLGCAVEPGVRDRSIALEGQIHVIARRNAIELRLGGRKVLGELAGPVPREELVLDKDDDAVVRVEVNQNEVAVARTASASLDVPRKEE